ncbi:unnamed protein product [Vicia faba]|uniref:Retrotransposon gag domain-containing protein n=1 Tax=Vicia faba TaxID=3906 RepID=A0AAV1A540_VICFA|nr:unnamed protein product [Vicia faba]
MENERNVADNRYDSFMSILTKLVHQKEQQPTTIVQATTSSSGVTKNISTVPMNTTVVSHVVTPSRTPTQTTPIYSQSPLHTIVSSSPKVITISPPALELRFVPSTYANYQAELFKLKQTGSFVEYQAAFEKLGNQVVGLSHEAILNCFISGLAPAIQNEIVIHKPVSISQAIGLAKLIESKIQDSKPKFQIFSPMFSLPNPHTPTPPPYSATLKPVTTTL